MRIGFRAGADPAIRVTDNDFAGTLRAWQFPESAGTLIARVFPGSPFVGGDDPVSQVLKRLDRAAAPALAAGMIPHLSIKPNVAATLAGRMDRLFAAIGQWAVERGHLIYFTVWHEPENDAMGAGRTARHNNHVGRATNFVAVHTRAYQRIKAVAGDQVRMGPCYMSYHWRPASPTTSGTAAGAWLVPSAYRDFSGVDVYTSNGALSRGASLRVKTDFQRWRTTLAAPDPEIYIVERGVTRNPPGKNGERFQADTIADDLTYLRELGGHAYSYWNSGGATDDSEFRLAGPARTVLAAAAGGR